MPRTRADILTKKTAGRRFATLALVALLALGSGLGAFFALKTKHPSREQCEKAVAKLYAASGWESDFPRHVITEDESVSSCMRLAKQDVDCILDSTSHVFHCDAASRISLEQLESGLWCFARTINTTGEKNWEGCAFSKQKCESRRSDAEGSAYGAKLGDCTSFPRLYGIYAGEKGESRSWYGMFPEEKACLLYWRKNSGNLRNVEPGCREVRSDGKPGDRVPEPQRPVASWPGKKPSRVWCYRSGGGGYGRCFEDDSECNRERKASTDPTAILFECEPTARAWYFASWDTASPSEVVKQEAMRAVAAVHDAVADQAAQTPRARPSHVEIWVDPTVCQLRADAAWNDGAEASACEPL